jgi:hypothetical protein
LAAIAAMTNVAIAKSDTDALFTVLSIPMLLAGLVPRVLDGLYALG